MRRLIPATALAAALALAGCGAARPLHPAPGQSLPVAPYGATQRPTPVQLLTATQQQRPLRSNELLTRSEARRDDAFNLPPGDNGANTAGNTTAADTAAPGNSN